MAGTIELAGVGVELVPSNSESGGTVTSVSVVTANGVSGSVATATTTPAITLVLGDIEPDSVTTESVGLTGVAFADLPAVPVAGMMAYVTDSDTVVWGATIVGGSTDKVLAWFNGTNWTVAGK